MSASDWLALIGILVGILVTWTGALIAYSHAVFAPKTDVVELRVLLQNLDKKVTDIWERLVPKKGLPNA